MVPSCMVQQSWRTCLLHSFYRQGNCPGNMESGPKSRPLDSKSSALCTFPPWPGKSLSVLLQRAVLPTCHSLGDGSSWRVFHLLSLSMSPDVFILTGWFPFYLFFFTVPQVRLRKLSQVGLNSQHTHIRQTLLPPTEFEKTTPVSGNRVSLLYL